MLIPATLPVILSVTVLSVVMPPARAAGPEASILIMPFGFLDTSGEPGDQKPAHAARLGALSAYVSDALQGKGVYRIVPATPGILACAGGDQDCLLNQAQKAGSDMILAGAVQKASTLISQVWVGIFDAKTGKRLLFRQLSFRGDTDEAWQHAARFLVQQIEADAPRQP